MCFINKNNSLLEKAYTHREFSQSSNSVLSEMPLHTGCEKPPSVVVEVEGIAPRTLLPSKLALLFAN